MNKSVPISTLIQGEISARYAPQYFTSQVITNQIISNGLTPSMTVGQVLVDGNLQFFPRAEVVALVDLLSYLGYTRKHLVDLVSNKRINLVAAGMGGINSGIMYWLNKIQQELGVPVCKNLYFTGIDNEMWDISNLIRIHFHPLGLDGSLPKARWVSEVLKRYNSTIRYTPIVDKIDVDSLHRFSTDFVPIVFGATNIVTRGKLSQSKDCVYFQVTQSDHNLNMFINPEITMKSQDVYMSIFMNEFPLLSLKATIKLLEVVREHANGIDPIKEREVELFDIQKYADSYTNNNYTWLGVVPTDVEYSRHNGYSKRGPDAE